MGFFVAQTRCPFGRDEVFNKGREWGVHDHLRTFDGAAIVALLSRQGVVNSGREAGNISVSER